MGKNLFGPYEPNAVFYAFCNGSDRDIVLRLPSAPPGYVHFRGLHAADDFVSCYKVIVRGRKQPQFEVPEELKKDARAILMPEQIVGYILMQLEKAKQPVKVISPAQALDLESHLQVQPQVGLAARTA
jgi:hypothetical protein